VPPQPAESDGALDTRAELLATAASRQKWLIDAFDEDTAILHRFDAVKRGWLKCRTIWICA
jgi:hypothetical protein